MAQASPSSTINFPTVPGQGKYTQLLVIIEELGRDIRLSYAGSRSAAERLKMGIQHARILVRECLLETEHNARQWSATIFSDSYFLEHYFFLHTNALKHGISGMTVFCRERLIRKDENSLDLYFLLDRLLRLRTEIYIGVK